MFKIAFILGILLYANDCAAQLFELKGYAYDSTGIGQKVSVEVNDTLTKYFSQQKYNAETVDTIAHNKKLYALTDSNCVFSLLVTSTDSLNFWAEYHFEFKISVKDFIKSNKTVYLKPIPCTPYVACNEESSNDIYFIGNFISMNHLEHPYYCDDEMLNPKYEYVYKVLKVLDGKYSSDTIKFSTYMHVGRPRLSDYKTSLLIVRTYCDSLNQNPHQFYPLYQTVDGKWAGAYPAGDCKFLGDLNTVHAQPIDFIAPVEFKLYSANGSYNEEAYPSPFYETKESTAQAIYGCFPEDLVKIKKAVFSKIKMNEKK